jgi:hypothetical protein
VTSGAWHSETSANNCRCIGQDHVLADPLVLSSCYSGERRLGGDFRASFAPPARPPVRLASDCPLGVGRRAGPRCFCRWGAFWFLGGVAESGAAALLWNLSSRLHPRPGVASSGAAREAVEVSSGRFWWDLASCIGVRRWLSSGFLRFELVLVPAMVLAMARRMSALSITGGAGGGAAEGVGRFAGEGSGLLWPDRKRLELGVCRRPMSFQYVSDPVLRSWWLLRLFKAFWLGVHPPPRFVVVGAFVAVRAGGGSSRRLEVDEDEGPQRFLLMYPLLVFLYLCASLCCILTTG